MKKTKKNLMKPIFPQLIMQASEKGKGLKLTAAEVDKISRMPSIRKAAFNADAQDAKVAELAKGGVTPEQLAPSTGLEAVYTLRVDLTYNGNGRKPDEHVVRAWLVDTIMRSEAPPSSTVFNRANGEFKSVTVLNEVSIQVRCAGCVS